MDNDIIKEAREKLEASIDYDREERTKAMDDVEFGFSDDQWDSEVRNERAGRPCLTINKLPGFLDQIVGNQLQSRVGIKVSPVDNYSDPKTAEIIEGLIRNIEYNSFARVVYNTALKNSVASGFGAMRIVTEYATDEAFEQIIKIKSVDNPFSVYFGPGKEIDRSDSEYAFLVDDIDKDIFNKKYPNAQLIDFEIAENELRNKWVMENTVRIAEYFYKEPITKTIYLLDNGMVVDKISQGDNIVKERIVKTHKVMWRLISGVETLEGPKEWPSKYIPLVPVWGKRINIKGVERVRGLFRYAKDPQRIYNYWRTASTEAVALAPKAPYILTAKQLGNYKELWDRANKDNLPYLVIDPDPNAPMPTRQQFSGVPTGMITETMNADQEMRDTMSIQKAKLGMPSNEKSGRAIIERKRESNTANFEYIDNLSIAITHLGRILIDLIPKIYDTPRIERVIGADGKAKRIPLNQEFEENEKIVLHDLTVGKYDVVVDIGPGYATQRQEMQDIMTAFIQSAPDLLKVIPDLFIEAQDWPHKEKFVKRLRKLVPPEFLEENNKEIKPEQVQMIVKAEVEKILQNMENQKSVIELEQKKIQTEQELEKLKQLRAKSQLEEIKFLEEKIKLKDDIINEQTTM